MRAIDSRQPELSRSVGCIREDWLGVTADRSIARVRACTIAKLEGRIGELQESPAERDCRASCGRPEHNLWFPNPSTLIAK